MSATTSAGIRSRITTITTMDGAGTAITIPAAGPGMEMAIITGMEMEMEITTALGRCQRELRLGSLDRQMEREQETESIRRYLGTMFRRRASFLQTKRTLGQRREV